MYGRASLDLLRKRVIHHPLGKEITESAPELYPVATPSHHAGKGEAHEAPTVSAAGEISLSVDKQPTASGGPETQDYGEQLDIIWFSTDHTMSKIRISCASSSR